MLKNAEQPLRELRPSHSEIGGEHASHGGKGVIRGREYALLVH